MPKLRIIEEIEHAGEDALVFLGSMVALAWILKNPKKFQSEAQKIGQTYTDAVSALIPPPTTPTTPASDGTQSADGVPVEYPTE